jgi:hypothetical protein
VKSWIAHCQRSMWVNFYILYRGKSDIGNLPSTGPIFPGVEVERSKRVSGTGLGSRFLFLEADFTVDIMMVDVEF